VRLRYGWSGADAKGGRRAFIQCTAGVDPAAVAAAAAFASSSSSTASSSPPAAAASSPSSNTTIPAVANRSVPIHVRSLLSEEEGEGLEALLTTFLASHAVLW